MLIASNDHFDAFYSDILKMDLYWWKYVTISSNNELQQLNISLGIASITNKEFQDPTSVSFVDEQMIDIFWNPVDGARVGLEYAHGRRHNNDGQHFTGY